MLPKWHALFGVVFAVLLLLVFDLTWIEAVIVFIASVCIDVDHYIYYVFRKKDFSLKRAYNYINHLRIKSLKLSRDKRNERFIACHFLHGIESIIILVLLGYFVSSYFFYIGIGFAFHLLIDIAYQRRFQDRWDRVSIIYDYFKFKKLKRVF